MHTDFAFIFFLTNYGKLIGFVTMERARELDENVFFTS